MAAGGVESDRVQKIHVLRNTGTCLKPYPQWTPKSTFEYLNHSYSILRVFFNAFYLSLAEAYVQCMFNRPHVLVSIKFRLNHV